MYWHMTKPYDFTEALTSPSVARNRDPILSVLRRVLPPTGQVLEIASGTGEHAVHFAAALSHLTWQPTDRDEQALKSIAAHRAVSGLPNLLAPLFLDAAAPEWPVGRADAISAINMVHISPWQATQGLMAGAGRILPPGGILYLYGAYKENGAHTTPSNAAFEPRPQAAQSGMGCPRRGSSSRLGEGTRAGPRRTYADARQQSQPCL
jgi:SAM-dependent methyltransferase